MAANQSAREFLRLAKKWHTKWRPLLVAGDDPSTNIEFKSNGKIENAATAYALAIFYLMVTCVHQKNIAFLYLWQAIEWVLPDDLLDELQQIADPENYAEMMAEMEAEENKKEQEK